MSSALSVRLSVSPAPAVGSMTAPPAGQALVGSEEGMFCTHTWSSPSMWPASWVVVFPMSMKMQPLSL